MSPLRLIARMARIRGARALALLGFAALAVLAMLVPAEPALAREGTPAISASTAKSTYRIGEPVTLTVAVRNTSAAACQLAARSDGTVQVTTLTRDGVPVTPTFTTTYYGAGYDNALKARLMTVKPGEQVTFPLGLLGQSLLITSPTEGGDALALLWPVDDPGRYQLSLAYRMPAVAGVTANACPTPNEIATVAFTVGEHGGTDLRWIFVIVAGVLVLALIAVIVWWIRRRGRGQRAGTAVAIVLGIVVALPLVLHPAPASAKWEVASGSSAEFTKAVNFCFEVFTYPGNDPAGIMNDIVNGKPMVSIHQQLPWAGSNTTPTPAAPSGKGSSGILWNENASEEIVDKVQADPCTELYHELFHAYENMHGTASNAMCGNTKIPTDEVEASFAENKFRSKRKLHQRDTYNGKKLPPSLSVCEKKKKDKGDTGGGKDGGAGSASAGSANTGSANAGSANAGSANAGSANAGSANAGGGKGYGGSQGYGGGKGYGGGQGSRCAGGGCGGSNGDPHITTFDQTNYDFQSVGEFTAVRAATDNLEIQVRQEPFNHSRTVSVNTAIAARVGADKVGFSLDVGAIVVRVNGAVTTLNKDEKRRLPAGGTLTRRPNSGSFTGDAYTVTWPDGSSAWIDPTGQWALRLLVDLASARRGKVTGLLGDFDGDQANDLVPRGGHDALPAHPSFDQLYRTFGDSWRITQDASLFDYAAGKSTAAYTDKSLPERAVTVNDLPQSVRDQARQVCQWAQVNSPDLLADCVLDLSLTGLLDFGIDTIDLQAARPEQAGAPSAAATMISPSAPGTPAVWNFPGTAGQQVFVDVLSSPVKDGCGKLTLLGPDKTHVAAGCLRGGKGYIDRTTLPATGEYQVVVGDGSTGGQTQLRLVTVTDQKASIKTDGTPAAATVRDPGGLAVLSFSGHAGDSVSVDVPSATLPDSCSVRLRDAHGKDLATECLVGGSGHIDTTPLPATGQYTIVIDPPGADTGTVQVRLYVAVQQQNTLTVNGPAVTARITASGDSARFTFTGHAGQVVSVHADNATLPDGCGTLALVSPSGNDLVYDCLVNGAGATNPLTLPVDGEYAVTVAPGTHTGQVRLWITDSG